MNDPLTISIADWLITLQLDECDEAMRARIRKWYAAFIVPTRSDAMSIRVDIEPGQEFIPFVKGGVWQIRTTIQNGRTEFESHLEKGWFDRQAGQGRVVVRPTGDIENYLRVLYALFCVESRSLLLHSCGVIRDERGYVFFGPSGSGKTTTTRLSSQYTILSDDLVIIKKVADRFRVFGVPFRGELPEAPRSNAVADLVGLFSLVKDSRHFLAPIALPEAVAQLARCVPFVMAQPENARCVTDTCIDLATQVPVRAMHFEKNEGFWEMIR